MIYKSDKDIERVIALNKPESVIRSFTESYLQGLEFAKWEEAMKSEYELLFPKYRKMTDEEFNLYVEAMGDLNLLSIEETKVPVDYSEDETYMTYDEWMEETVVVQEAIETTEDTPAVAEVREKMRVYENVSVDADAYLESISYESLEKVEARKYLADTDWKILRHIDQEKLGIKQSLTHEEFSDILIKRQSERDLL